MSDLLRKKSKILSISLWVNFVVMDSRFSTDSYSTNNGTDKHGVYRLLVNSIMSLYDAPFLDRMADTRTFVSITIFSSFIFGIMGDTVWLVKVSLFDK